MKLTFFQGLTSKLKHILTFALCFCLSVLFSFGFLNEPARAQAFFESPKQFVVKTSCIATRSIRKGTDPVELTVDEIYTALGENKIPGGTHAYIEVEGTRKWVALSCGQYEGEVATTPPTEEPKDFLPFFDEIDNPIPLRVGGIADITPVPPQLNKFDRAVVKACGEPGKRVSRREFVDLMNDNPEVLEQVKEFVGDRVFANRPSSTSSSDFLQDLTDAWFSNAEGFNHIFCGEPVPGGKIGGLHFWGRYLELQEASLAGRLPGNTSREEVVPGTIYTLGVEMSVDGGIASSKIKGYGLTLSAEDILKFVTKAFRDNPTRSSRSSACLLDVEDEGKEFKAVFVRRASGIRTFYPDATPRSNTSQCQV